MGSKCPIHLSSKPPPRPLSPSYFCVSSLLSPSFLSYTLLYSPIYFSSFNSPPKDSFQTLPSAYIYFISSPSFPSLCINIFPSPFFKLCPSLHQLFYCFAASFTSSLLFFFSSLLYPPFLAPSLDSLFPYYLLLFLYILHYPFSLPSSLYHPPFLSFRLV